MRAPTTRRRLESVGVRSSDPPRGFWYFVFRYAVRDCLLTLANVQNNKERVRALIILKNRCAMKL
eukprot:scaffold1610_cov257-Pinguiococcus_pyrenoidosus.AAC.52